MAETAADPKAIAEAKKAMRLSLLQIQLEEAQIHEDHLAIQAEYHAWREANAAIFAKQEEFTQRMIALKTPLIALREKHSANVKAYEATSGIKVETLTVSS